MEGSDRPFDDRLQTVFEPFGFYANQPANKKYPKIDLIKQFNLFVTDY